MDAITQTVQRVSHMTIIVDDQDKAIDFYNKVFGTEIRGDNEFEFDGKTTRWVTIGIPGDDLEIAVTPPMPNPAGEMPKVGDGNMTVVASGNVQAVCDAFAANGGTVVTAPEILAWGESAIVRDPCGNPWNIVDMTKMPQ